MDFAWSSYPQYLAVPSRRPVWLRLDRLLGEWGIPKDSAAGRRVFGERMEWRRRDNSAKEFKAVERGWCLGGEEFRKELLEQVTTRPGASHFGEAVQEALEVQAERLVAAGLKRLGWTEADLRKRPKGDAKKVKLAQELRALRDRRLRRQTHRRICSAVLLVDGRTRQPAHRHFRTRLVRQRPVGRAVHRRN